MIVKQNRVKRALEAGGTAVGAFIFEFCTTGIGRIAASAGADFVLFDLEHTGWSLETVRPAILAAKARDIVPFIRVPATEYHLIARPLDIGAMGVMVPMVETGEQAGRIVSFAKYPPDGERGFGLLYSDEVEGGDTAATMMAANREQLLIALVETAKGVEQAHEIASLDGIDVLWIGHNDLTNSFGIPGQFEDARYLEAVEHVLAACNEHGKAAGMTATDIEEGRSLLERGFRCVGLGDVWVYEHALRQIIEGLRETGAGGRGKGTDVSGGERQSR
jgi:2-keto-3-deoxy-L-rhamnonate aldolase RhmA